MPPMIRPDETIFSPQMIRVYIDQEPADRVKRRLQAILMLMEGVTQESVAAELGCSTASIRTWTRRWNQGGYQALLDVSRGSWTTNTAREAARECGYDLTRVGSYFRMQPLATNAINDSRGEPVQPVWFANWDRPSKGGLRSLFE